MTACKSTGLHRGLLLGNSLRPKAVTSYDDLWRLQQAALIDHIPIFGRRQLDFLSLVNRCWFCLFQKAWSDPKTGPVSVSFHSVTLICISPHIERKKKLLRAPECAFRRLGVLDQNAKFQVIWVEILRYFQPSCSLLSKSFGFLDPLWIRW